MMIELAPNEMIFSSSSSHFFPASTFWIEQRHIQMNGDKSFAFNSCCDLFITE